MTKTPDALTKLFDSAKELPADYTTLTPRPYPSLTSDPATADPVDIFVEFLQRGKSAEDAQYLLYAFIALDLMEDPQFSPVREEIQSALTLEATPSLFKRIIG